tara:strand:+ start:884 stop:1252 length:369 start_codon:yes stop_codon:yes gene_type:complete
MKTYIIIGALLSAIGVIIGAFGSHSLKTKLNPEELVIYDIATRYLMYHSIGIISLGILAYNVPDSVVEIPIIIMLIGIILFSGSLYLISIKGYTKLGIITPFGGTAFIVSWVLLAINIFKLP